jgi:hypothetical protein
MEVLMKFLKHLSLLTFILPMILFAEGMHVVVPQKEIVQEDEELDTAAYLFDRYPPIYYSQSHHWLSMVTLLDNNQYTLELEDGSTWKVNSYDAPKALNWRSNDPLTVTQNNRWFSKHPYRIINKSNGTSIEATLYLGPIAGGAHSKWIVSIDQSRREITLNDYTHWEISYLDGSTFRDWALNDYVIIGTNSNTSIWDSGSDALLINVNMNTATRAKQF